MSLSAELLENSFDLFRKTAKNFSRTEKVNLFQLPHYMKFCPFCLNTRLLKASKAQGS